MTGDYVEKLWLYFGETGLVLHHRPGDAREFTHETGNWSFRIHQSFEDFNDLSAAHHDCSNFGDPIARVVLVACRLEIDHHVRQARQHIGIDKGVGKSQVASGILKRRLSDILRQSGGKKPTPRVVARKLRPSGEDRFGHVLCHNSRRAWKIANVSDERHRIRRPPLEKLCSASREVCCFGARIYPAPRQLHGSSLTSGHVIQRAPPPPRTSSAPSKVMTARSPSPTLCVAER